MLQKRRDWVDDLVDLTALLPWWTWIAVAIASSLLLQWLTAPGPAAQAGRLAADDTAGALIVRGMAVLGQYVLPLVFLGLAATSAFGRSRRKRAGEQVRIEPDWSRKRTPQWRRRGTAKFEPDRHPERKNAARPISSPSRVKEDRWSLDLLRSLEWKRFAHLCTAYFEELGFRAKTIRTGPDGSVEIHLFQMNARRPGIIVQCKARNSSPVGVKPVREMQRVMAAKGIGEAIFVTSGTYSSEARQFAKGKNIHLISQSGLLSLLSRLKPEQRQNLFTLATAGDYNTPTCPSCGSKMVLRAPTAGGKSCWVCQSFPRCRSTLTADAAGQQPH